MKNATEHIKKVRILAAFRRNIENPGMYLTGEDIKDLGYLYDELHGRPISEWPKAMYAAEKLETIVREEIPAEIWALMGGEIVAR
jgi:hypothetical protein